MICLLTVPWTNLNIKKTGPDSQMKAWNSLKYDTLFMDSNRKVYPFKHCSWDWWSTTLRDTPSNIKVGACLIQRGKYLNQPEKTDVDP